MGPLFLALLAAPVVPWSADYRLTSRDWNGLASLGELAREAGCPVEARDVVAWDELRGTDVLWLVHPRSTVDAERLALWLAAGGRAVVADDFGAADALLRRLDLERRTAAVEGTARFQENANLPEARSTGATPLARSAARLVTNHPAWFATRGPGAFEFSPGAAVVVEGTLGRGRFVALADPSVLINNMLEIDDDRAFARALVGATCRPRVDRMVVVTGEFVERGDPPAVLEGAPEGARPVPVGAEEHLGRAAEELNRALAGLGEGRPRGTTLGALALFLAAAAILVLGRALPTPAAPLDGQWTRVPAPPSDAPPPPIPMLALRDEVTLRVGEALGESPGLLGADAVAEALARRYGDEAGEIARALWREMAGAPSRRRLERAHRLAVELFALLSRGAAR